MRGRANPRSLRRTQTALHRAGASLPSGSGFRRSPPHPVSMKTGLPSRRVLSRLPNSGTAGPTLDHQLKSPFPDEKGFEPKNSIQDLIDCSGDTGNDRYHPAGIGDRSRRSWGIPHTHQERLDCDQAQVIVRVRGTRHGGGQSYPDTVIRRIFPDVPPSSAEWMRRDGNALRELPSSSLKRNIRRIPAGNRYEGYS